MQSTTTHTQWVAFTTIITTLFTKIFLPQPISAFELTIVHTNDVHARIEEFRYNKQVPYSPKFWSLLILILGGPIKGSIIWGEPKLKLANFFENCSSQKQNRKKKFWERCTKIKGDELFKVYKN